MCILYKCEWWRIGRQRSLRCLISKFASFNYSGYSFCEWGNYYYGCQICLYVNDIQFQSYPCLDTIINCLRRLMLLAAAAATGNKQFIWNIYSHKELSRFRSHFRINRHDILEKHTKQFNSSSACYLLLPLQRLLKVHKDPTEHKHQLCVANNTI